MIRFACESWSDSGARLLSNAAGLGSGPGRLSGTAPAGKSAAQVRRPADDRAERKHHPSRDGLYVQPTLHGACACGRRRFCAGAEPPPLARRSVHPAVISKGAVANLAMETTFAATFTGNTWASPLYRPNGPGGKGLFFAVTNGNDVFALDETTGATVWTKNIGTAPARAASPAATSRRIGIISTPVIDEKARTHLRGRRHRRHHRHHRPPDPRALGRRRQRARRLAGRRLDHQARAASPFTASPQNQRSALSLVNGILYVAYGGHNGDCGNYRGWVMAVDTARYGGHNGDCGNYRGWVMAIDTANPASRGAFVTGDARRGDLGRGRDGLRRKRRLRGHREQPGGRHHPRRQRGDGAGDRSRRRRSHHDRQRVLSRRAGSRWTARTPT